MQVHRDLNNLPFFKNAVITIGTFDGVHTGHVQIINQLKKEAAAINGETVIITFHPHPRFIINSTSQNTNTIQLLNTLDEKIELLQKQNIDHLVVVPFSISFSEQSAEAYIQNFLVEKFKPHTIIIGYDHRFGKNRLGDYKLLELYQSKYNYLVKEIPEHVLHHVAISSTRIRNALKEHDIKNANECLGYDYFFEGTVINGDKIGRTLGYPTANIQINDDDKLVPANGIYAVEILLNHQNELLQGMMSIGIRPTVGGTSRVIEVNIFDFEKNIYDEPIRVYVKDFLRKEVKFDNLEELKNQMAIDKINTLKILNN